LIDGVQLILVLCFCLFIIESYPNYKKINTNSEIQTEQKH